MMDNPLVLIIGKVWAEPASTAAGARMLQLMEVLQEWGADLNFWTAAKKTGFEEDLESLNISCRQIELNDSSFDTQLRELNPDVVIFDRFMTEEQFGWRVAEQCPESLRILDTEDLHFLREARIQAVKNNSGAEAGLFTPLAKRELGSILRCDFCLIISEVEMTLLKQKFNIPDGLLHYVPFMISEQQINAISNRKGYHERDHFISIGNFLHEPNWKAVLKLKSVWPLIRKQLPAAEIHIFGAYLPEKARQLHNEEEGFCIKGRADSAVATLGQYRAILSPIQAGAGLKGKFIDAMLAGTPSVTTTTGAEGMNAGDSWPGYICDTDQAFADAAVELFRNEHKWIEFQKMGSGLLKQKFSRDAHAAGLLQKIEQTGNDLEKHRQQHFTGQVLQQQMLNAQKYMSLWIEEKNKNRN